MLVSYRRLKLLPVIALAVLLLAWLVSVYFHVAITVRPGKCSYDAYIDGGVLSLGASQGTSPGVSWSRKQGGEWIGDFHYHRAIFWRAVDIPLVCIATALLPIALGCVSRFRFRLWHWLAFTAIVAVQAAYFVRADR